MLAVSSRSTAARVLAVALISAAAAGCRADDPGADDAPLTGVSMSQHSGPENIILVTVRDANGDPVQGRTVVAVHGDNGPYRADGSLRSDVTGPQGLADIGDLESGDYCVHTSPVTPEDLRPGPGEPPVVPPTDPGQGPSLSSPGLGTALSGQEINGDRESVPLTLSNWLQHCVNSPPVAVSGGGTTPVTLFLQPPAVTVSGQFLPLEGTSGAVPAWAVVDLSGLVPWSLPASQVGDVKPGLLVAADPGAADGSFTLPTPGGPVVVESQLVPLPTGFQTASASADPAGGQGSVQVGDLPLAPELCRTGAFPESEDDGRRLELLSPYRHGFLADALLQPDPTAMSVSYRQVGEGEATFRMRVRGGRGGRGQSTRTLQVRYRCTGSGCERVRTVGSLLREPSFSHDVFFRLVDPNGPEWEVTVLASGLPSSRVETGVSTPGDQIPDPSRERVSSGLVPTPLPGTCVSEESRWILGG